jgi:O-antigen/teichoic acid export membrane protein
VSPVSQNVPPAAVEPAGDRLSDSFELNGRTLRQHTARGTIVNALYLIFLNVLGLLKGLIVAALISPGDYGLFAILGVALGTLLYLKQVGISDKYIQQDEDQQELAFQKAFTLELIFSAAFFVLLLAAVPLVALVYHLPDLVAPGFAIALMLPAQVFAAPQWVYYRKMQFKRQRAIESVGPIVSFVATVGLAAGGAGYWSLVIGALAGAWAAAAISVVFSPYPLKLRYESGTAREYVSFSWPLLIYSGSGTVMAQTAALLGEWKLGLAGVGAMALAARFQQFSQQLDGLVTGTMYPAICAVRDRTELLLESFVKSNRLALMWGMPFGVAVALFAPDLVEFVIGQKWEPAVGLLQAFGIIAAIDQIGFNWDAFFRARGQTKPMAVVSAVTVVVFFATTVPLLLTFGLKGYAFGIAAGGLAHLITRSFFLTRVFPALELVRHALRAVTPTIPAIAAVLAMRLAEGGDRTAGLALSELVLYCAVTVAATLYCERRLLREVAGYLRGRASPAGVPS